MHTMDFGGITLPSPSSSRRGMKRSFPGCVNTLVRTLGGRRRWSRTQEPGGIPTKGIGWVRSVEILHEPTRVRWAVYGHLRRAVDERRERRVARQHPCGEQRIILDPLFVPTADKRCHLRILGRRHKQFVYSALLSSLQQFRDSSKELKGYPDAGLTGSMPSDLGALVNEVKVSAPSSSRTTSPRVPSPRTGVLQATFCRTEWRQRSTRSWFSVQQAIPTGIRWLYTSPKLAGGLLTVAHLR